MSGSRPYRDRAEVEPDRETAPKVLPLGDFRSRHGPPPLLAGLAAPVIFAVLIFCVGVALDASIAAVVAVLVLVALSVGPIRLHGVSLAVHANGLVLSRRGRPTQVLFEDVNEVWFEIDRLQSDAGAALRGLRLVEHSGREVALPLGLEGGALIARVVLHNCSRSLLAEARSALGEGEVLTFGEARLGRDGVEVRGAKLAWSGIRLAVVTRARVELYRRQTLIPWRTVRLDRVPHPTVFVALVLERAPRHRVDDRILVPFATSTEARAALREHVRRGGEDFAVRNMVAGGVLFAAGIVTLRLTHTAGCGTQVVPYGPIILGVLAFGHGAAAYLRRKP